MDGVAEQVTGVPEQTVLAEVTIEMLTGELGLTVIETALDDAGLPVAQDKLVVSTHEIASLFAGA